MMIKKIILVILTINTIVIYLFLNNINKDKKLDNSLVNQVVDIKNRDDLINTYSIKVMENSPANE